MADWRIKPEQTTYWIAGTPSPEQASRMGELHRNEDAPLKRNQVMNLSAGVVEPGQVAVGQGVVVYQSQNHDEWLEECHDRGLYPEEEEE